MHEKLSRREVLPSIIILIFIFFLQHLRTEFQTKNLIEQLRKKSKSIAADDENKEIIQSVGKVDRMLRFLSKLLPIDVRILHRVPNLNILAAALEAGFDQIENDLRSDPFRFAHDNRQIGFSIKDGTDLLLQFNGIKKFDYKTLNAFIVGIGLNEQFDFPVIVNIDVLYPSGNETDIGQSDLFQSMISEPLNFIWSLGIRKNSHTFRPAVIQKLIELIASCPDQLIISIPLEYYLLAPNEFNALTVDGKAYLSIWFYPGQFREISPEQNRLLLEFVNPFRTFLDLG